MKKYLIRSGMSPLDIRSPEEIVLKNLIGGNVGNLIYAYSIYRNLTTENVSITPDRYRINSNDAQKINENYDAYIIPLADAFRDDFAKNELKRYTALLKKLTIPVIVIGVGVKAPIDKDITEGFKFDNQVKEFVKAVLKNSSMIGVRGQITADYLTSLGFREGTDHMVIGCPSMYAFGRELNIKVNDINSDSKIGINSSKLSPENVLKFIQQCTEEYPNYSFIPQWRKEMKMVFLGNEKLEDNTKYYPNNLEHEFYTSGKVTYPLNAKGWIDYLGNMDLVVGSRLHGNITGTISGTPSILIPKDARMRELTDYHNLTHVWADEINEKTKLSDLIEQVDFHSPQKFQSENYDRFTYFLEKNGLDHIGKYGGKSKLDLQMEKIDTPKMLEPINTLKFEEIINRSISYEKAVQDRLKQREDKIKSMQKKINEKNTKIRYYRGTLNRKSVKLGLKFGDAFKKVKRNNRH